MSKYGDNLSADDIYVKRLHWDEFVPPLSAGDPNDQTLASVLLTGNDANQKDIINLNKLEVGTVEASAKVDTPLVEATKIEVGECEVSINADGLRPNGTKSTITNFDLTSATNTFPSTFIPNLSSVLTNGNDAGEKDITGVKDLTIISTGKISALNPDSSGLDTKIMKTDDLEPYTAGGTVSQIGKTTAFHAITGETLNANAKLEARTAENGCHFAASSFYSTEPTPTLKATLTNGILKTNSIVVDNDITSASPAIAMSEFPGATGTGAIACNGLIQAGQVSRAPLFDCVDNTDVPPTPAKFKISSGGSFEGSDPAKCVFTNCDFSSSTNVFGPDAEDRFTYGCVFRPATTFKKEWDQEDGHAQVLSENVFTYTIPTTNPDHANQIAELYFFVEEYGYGNNHVSLFMSDEDGQNRSVMTNRGGDVKWQTSQGPIIGRDDRKTGSVIAKMYLHSMPTDGVRRRIYPGFRSNDPAPGPEDEGRFIIEAGQSTTAGAPGPCILIVKPIPSKAGTYPNFREIT
jgi:hypothetical protein